MVIFWKSWHKLFSSKVFIEFLEVVEEFNINYTFQNENNETTTRKLIYNVNSGWVKRIEILKVKDQKLFFIS